MQSLWMSSTLILMVPKQDLLLNYLIMKKRDVDSWKGEHERRKSSGSVMINL